LGPKRLVLAGIVVASTALVAACGGNEKQDADEQSATYKLDVISASFPGRQRLAQRTELKLEVKNVDDRTIPNLAVTIDGFEQRRDDPTLANPRRPVWVLNTPPFNSDSAFTDTWTVGPVPAGQTRTMRWSVTAVKAGTYSVRYKVAAGLQGKAKAELPDGSQPKGSFLARITRAPRPVSID
jgi:hypothetical protein